MKRLLLTIMAPVIGVAIGLLVGRIYYPPKIKVPLSYVQHLSSSEKNIIKGYLVWDEVNK